MPHVYTSKPRYGRRQISDIQAASPHLVGSILKGEDYEAKFEILHADFVAKHGVLVPANVSPDAPEVEKWSAARNVSFPPCSQLWLISALP